MITSAFQQPQSMHLRGGGSSSLNSPIRTLTISKPTTKHIEKVINDFRANIILVVKYPFHAESANELSVKSGDILKLLDKPNDGWILVKFVDKLQAPGLIPALYVDIAINDPVNPITLNWLHSKEDSNIIDDHNWLNLQFNKIESKFQTINNKAYPVSASISNFFLYKDRYWYRLDVGFSDKSKSYLCRYYQDFYNLHISMLEMIEKICHSDTAESSELKLPKLPEPLPTTLQKSNNDSASECKDEKYEVKREEEQQISILLKRCNSLNIYINKLILNKYFQTSIEFIDWLDLSYKNLPGYFIPRDQAIKMEEEEKEKEEYNRNDDYYKKKKNKKTARLTEDEINNKILPESVNVVKNYNENRLKLQQEKEEMERKKLKEVRANHNYSTGDLPARTRSKNIYNNYQQASRAFDNTASSRQTSEILGNGSRSLRNSFKSSLAGTTKHTSLGQALLYERKGSTKSLSNANSSSASNSSTSPTEFKSLEEFDGTPNTSSLSISSNSTPIVQQSTAFAMTPPFTEQQQQQSRQQSSSPQAASNPPYPIQSNETSPKYSPASTNSTIISPKTSYSPRPGLTPRLTIPETCPQSRPSPLQLQPLNNLHHHSPSKMSPLGLNHQIFPISGFSNPQLQQSPMINTMSSPFISSNSNSNAHQYIKCKIMNHDNEILAIKFNKSQFKTIQDMKVLIRQKVPYNKLFIKLPNLNNFENIDVVNFNITEFLRFNDKVMLKIT
ncbi:hypothetical protein KGF56_003146 [Candida oxycetoniae]|uniref:SH3 domain-containing protein n=1 Tax=Candida oxycetoniae TaxID=497107 RepID=A0AAI9WXT3_9ASCO|nr:uncharacterized protein KGF56_003146 [Candida oxycetoniae]KAI3404110.2 hypothetical protein KGF56_003146 [Candida oxycetoniae]